MRSPPGLISQTDATNRSQIGANNIQCGQMQQQHRSSWSWLVLFSSFLCTAMVDGLIFSFGLHILEMMRSGEFLTSSNSDLSLMHYIIPSGLLTGMHLYASPLANVLTNRFDYRPVALVNTCLTGLVLIGSAFIHDLDAFGLFFGICGGLSCGLIYFPALSIVAQWFKSRSALAVGLAICGSGLGTCGMAAVMEAALQTFSWRGVLIIYGAVFFQLSVAVAFFRPVEVHQAIQLMQAQRRAHCELKKRERQQAVAAIRRRKMLKAAANRAPARPVRGRRSFNAPRGGIIARILEEKVLQMSSSTGSLDGMIITRDNELVAIPRGGVHSQTAAAARTAALVAPHPTVRPGAASYTQLNHHPNSKLTTAPTTHRMPIRPASVVGGPGCVGDVTAAKSHQQSESTTLVLLTPPTSFSKSGVIRIADAVLQKLETQSVIAPGMRCPNMHNAFRSRSVSTAQSRISPHRALRQQRFASFNRPEEASAVGGGMAACATRAFRKGEGIDTSHRHFSAIGATHTPDTLVQPIYRESTNPPISTSPAVCVSSDSEVGSISAPSATNGDPQQLPAEGFGERVARSLSGASSASSLDPKTDGAINHELSRVCLDPAVKARIRSCIYRELKRNGRTREQSQRALHERSKSGHEWDSGSIVHRSTCSEMEAPVPNGAPSLQPSAVSLMMAMKQQQQQFDSESPSVLSLAVADYLDLQLLKSPCFLLLSLACTLRMLAFFTPYHILPLYLALADRNTACRSFSEAQSFEPEGFTNTAPQNVIFTVGVAHFLGRLIASAYIGHFVTSSKAQYLESHGCFRSLLAYLADPLVLNVATLVIGGVCLLSIPVAMVDLPAPPLSPVSDRRLAAASCASHPPILYFLVFVHTISSALTISLNSVIAVDLIGVHHLTPAFIYLLVFQGTGSIAGPLAMTSGISITPRLLSEPAYHPAKSSISSYFLHNPLDIVFYFCGLAFLLSALAYAPLRRIASWETRRYFARQVMDDADFLTASSTPCDAPLITEEQQHQHDSEEDDSVGDLLEQAHRRCANHESATKSKRKCSQLSDRLQTEEMQRKSSTCSHISVSSYITFLMPRVERP